MTRKDYGLMLCLVTLSGLIGGSLTSWLVSGEAVAEGSVPTAKVVQTERLQIVDANGHVRIELSAQPRGTADSTGVDLSQMHGFPSKARVEIRDQSGKVVWSAPPETKAMFVH